MNRFRTKKKEKEEASAPRPSMDSQPSGPFRMFGKGKKSQEDENPKQMDLTAALPPSDDFRTSLLMTGLSARFSMLREQDDPSSKLGKASDDSVLFPKRQSRLMDFGFGQGLGDIVEVESIKASNLSRVDSTHTSEDGVGYSIMDRARPNDGNNLFGGRQKIYKLGAGAKSGAMSGRTLYDDDVAKSSFQKWRVIERERLNGMSSSIDSDDLDIDVHNEYNLRRETSSTTSSGVSAGRDSTAATSVNSQFATSKDAQSAPANSFGGVERTVMRTRRLYEQSLNQELHDQQSSTLSRMDTLSRTRSRPSRAPELTPPVPSPTTTAFNERFTDRKSVNTKSSAPNLRSYSPQNNGPPSANSIESNNRNVSQDSPSFGGNPPLSPPISENDEYPLLPIQPNDVGKATAMGLFTRPTHQYDDSKFAQRQVQMQQNRDVPGVRSATDPVADKYSRSLSSSTQRTSSERYDARPNTKRVDSNHTHNNESSFFDDDDDDEDEHDGTRNSTNHAATSLGNSLTLGRPDDQDHPAFRKSALPTPLSLSSRASDSSSTSEHLNSSTTQTRDEPTEESSANGPAAAGLSGMVRQHLRNTSVASSVYDSNADGQGTPHTYVDSPPARNGVTNWQLSEDEFNPRSGHATPINQASPERMNQFRSRHQTKESKDEKEDFARHLADGARRVREKLTTYTDSDGEQQPLPAPPPVPQKDQGSGKSNALGILRSKSSRTSLFDRKGDKDSSDAKPPKSSKIGSSSTSPSLQRTGLEGKTEGKDESVHAGLKAFRQARRELQKMKEQDAQQRHLSTQKSDPALERPGASRAYSHDPGMSPPMYNGALSGQRSRAGSQAPSERDRSGSDSSNKGYSTNDRRGRRGVSQTRGDDNQSYNRSRSGSQVSAAASTPNLGDGTGAPPVPPINPRRKNAHSSLSRRSDDASSLPSPRLAVNGNSEMDSDSDNPRQNSRRITSDSGDRQFMNVPPAPTRRPPLPHANLSTNSVPGAMF